MDEKDTVGPTHNSEEYLHSKTRPLLSGSSKAQRQTLFSNLLKRVRGVKNELRSDGNSGFEREQAVLLCVAPFDKSELQNCPEIAEAGNCDELQLVSGDFALENKAKCFSPQAMMEDKYYLMSYNWGQATSLQKIRQSASVHRCLMMEEKCCKINWKTRHVGHMANPLQNLGIFVAVCKYVVVAA